MLQIREIRVYRYIRQNEDGKTFLLRRTTFRQKNSNHGSHSLGPESHQGKALVYCATRLTDKQDNENWKINVKI